MSPASTPPWERFASGELGASHRAHLWLAWESLERLSPAQALPRIEAALRTLAAAHGVPGMVHTTLTTLWLLVVAERRARCPAPDFEAFLAINEDLLDARGLPRRYYREATLSDPLARRVFVLPDRLECSPLPPG